MKKFSGASGKLLKEKDDKSESEEIIPKLQKQEKIMTIAIYTLIIITTISIVLILFVLLTKN
jgi:hypothetical protein